MHPSHFAKSKPDAPAYIMASSGEVVTFKQLDQRSNQIAHLFRAHGVNPGDTIAIFAENSPRYFEIAWAAQRNGWSKTPGVRIAASTSIERARSGFSMCELLAHRYVRKGRSILADHENSRG